jgi:hypothetical protein
MDGDAPARCTRTTKDGTPCSATPWRDGVCRRHREDAAASLAEGRRKGERARPNPSRAKRHLPAGRLGVDESRGVLGHTIAGVLAGSIGLGVATAVASLARAYGSLSEAARLEALAERLDAVEAVARRGGAA